MRKSPQIDRNGLVFNTHRDDDGFIFSKDIEDWKVSRRLQRQRKEKKTKKRKKK